MNLTTVAKALEGRASIRSQAVARIKQNRWSDRRPTNRAQQAEKAPDQAKISGCSILRHWLKSQITAIDVGVVSFDCAFLGQMILQDGRSVLYHAVSSKMVRIGVDNGCG